MNKVETLNEVNRLIVAGSAISSECWQYDLSKNEKRISIDAFVIDEEKYPLIIPEIEDALTENQLIWSNLDELDEINDPENTDLHLSMK